MEPSHRKFAINEVKQELFHVPKDQTITFQKEERLWQDRRAKSKRSCLPAVQCFIRLTAKAQEAFMKPGKITESMFLEVFKEVLQKTF